MGPGAERAAASAWARGVRRVPVGSGQRVPAHRIRWAKLWLQEHGARKHPSTGGRASCGPAGRGCAMLRSRPALRVCPRPRSSAWLSSLSLLLLLGSPCRSLSSCLAPHFSACVPWRRLVAQLSSPGTAHVRVGLGCGPARGRGEPPGPSCAGLWMEQCCFRGQAARWKTHTQPVKRLKKKRHHISAVVKSGWGHAAVCRAGVDGVSGAAGCCWPRVYPPLPGLRQ